MHRTVRHMIENPWRGPPRPVLSAAVDVGSVLQQHLDDLAPPSAARLVEGGVPRVVTAIHFSHVLLEAIQHYVL